MRNRNQNIPAGRHSETRRGGQSGRQADTGEDGRTQTASGVTRNELTEQHKYHGPRRTERTDKNKTENKDWIVTNLMRGWGTGGARRDMEKHREGKAHRRSRKARQDHIRVEFQNKTGNEKIESTLTWAHTLCTHSSLDVMQMMLLGSECYQMQSSLSLLYITWEMESES